MDKKDFDALKNRPKKRTPEPHKALLPGIGAPGVVDDNVAQVSDDDWLHDLRKKAPPSEDSEEETAPESK
jgi:hypothetical protein